MEAFHTLSQILNVSLEPDPLFVLFRITEKRVNLTVEKRLAVSFASFWLDELFCSNGKMLSRPLMQGKQTCLGQNERNSDTLFSISVEKLYGNIGSLFT